MDTELLSRAKTQDIEREMSRIRLAAAAERAGAPPRRAAPKPRSRMVSAMPRRLLRALREAS